MNTSISTQSNSNSATLDLKAFEGRELIRWEEGGSAAATLGFLYDSARNFVSNEFELAAQGGGGFSGWYDNSESGQAFQGFGRALLDEIYRAANPNEFTKSYEFVGELTAALVDGYERGELVPRAIEGLSGEAAGIVSALSDIIHASGVVLRQGDRSEEAVAVEGLKEMTIDMLAMKYMGNEKFRDHVNAEIADKMKGNAQSSEAIGLLTGRTLAGMATGSVLNPVQYLALVGGGTKVLDQAFDNAGIEGDVAIYMYEQASALTPHEREHSIEKNLGDLVTIESIIDNAVWGQPSGR